MARRSKKTKAVPIQPVVLTAEQEEERAADSALAGAFQAVADAAWLADPRDVIGITIEALGHVIDRSAGMVKGDARRGRLQGRIQDFKAEIIGLWDEIRHEDTP